MRSRRNTPQQQEAISRRLALLSAELAGVRGAPTREPSTSVLNDDEALEPASWRSVDAELAVAFRPWDETDIGREPTGAREATAAGLSFPGRHAARRRGPSLTGVVTETVRQRWALGPAHVAVLAVIVAVGLGLTTWWAIQARPQEVAPPGDLVARSLDSQALPTETPLLDIGPGSAVSDDPKELVVDVSGKVRQPGIAVLQPGARVVDALKAAGGARPGADLGALNLARLLIDGEQILVGVPQPSGVGAAAASQPGTITPGALVNINVADQPQLETLPGVGPVTAQAIMAWRTEHNGFGAVEELLDVQGIGEATLAQLAPHVTV